MKPGSELLVVAGEASGDAMAAPVVSKLDVPSFGVGGSALRAAGTDLCADLSRFTAMGFGAVLARSPRISEATLRLIWQVRKRRPRAALLVGYSEFNMRFGCWLRRRGVRVLWYGAPQIWAWRRGRARAVRRACDRLAVILPFEPALWRKYGVEAHYVGHPVLERPPPERSTVRERYGLTPYAEYVALLPGSRPHEVEQHLKAMALAVGQVRAERGALDARLVLAPSLDAHSRGLATRLATGLGISVLEAPAATVLPAFDAALAASGTVTLECAVAGVPPVIVYKTGALTHLLAKRLVRTSHVGLPNIVLGREAFPELLQDQVTPARMAEECTRLLEHKPEFEDECRAVRRTLLESFSAPVAGNGHTVSAARLSERPSERVARLLQPWLR